MQLIFATHVDDLIGACKPSAEYIIAKIKSLLILGTEDLGTFSIKITCRTTSEKLSELQLPVGRLENLAAEASSEEKE